MNLFMFFIFGKNESVGPSVRWSVTLLKKIVGNGVMQDGDASYLCRVYGLVRLDVRITQREELISFLMPISLPYRNKKDLKNH